MGPTAVPAMGRENYKGMKGADPMLILNFIRHMAAQVARDKKMRNYVKNQAFDWTSKFFLNAAKLIIPKVEMNHIERSNKVGIRPQLYDLKKKELVQDFVMLDVPNSTHIVNAISPAFTASFELADYISIHLPLNDSTRNFINFDDFNLFKKNYIFFTLFVHCV